MLDTDSEARRLQIFFVIIILYFVSIYASCCEFKYAIWGETTHAAVIQSRPAIVSSGSRMGAKKVLAVKYQFTQEDGTAREGVMNKGLGWTPDPDGTFAIEYLPDKHRVERLAGAHNYLGVGFFLVMTGVMVVYLVIMVRKAKARQAS